MPFGWNEAGKLGGLLFGALGPKDSGPHRGPRASRNYKAMLDDVYNYDPIRESEDAINVARNEVEQVMGNVAGDIIAPYSGAGSHGWLPDSRRDSLIAGGMADVGRMFGKYVADVRMNAIPMKARLIRETLDPVGGGGGGGPALGPDWIKGFGELANDIFRKKKVEPNPIIGI